jgi:hypothetical protein
MQQTPASLFPTRYAFNWRQNTTVRFELVKALCRQPSKSPIATWPCSAQTQTALAFLLTIIFLGLLTPECFSQSPDPITLLQGVEMAREQTPASRLHFHALFKNPLQENERDYVMEFDGDKRRALGSTPDQPRLFYDGLQACVYLPSSAQASLRNISDATAEALFDPRTFGLNSGLTWQPTVPDLLPYKNGKVQLVGKEQLRGIDSWHVRIAVEKPTAYNVDLWIGDTGHFPVYRYERIYDSAKQRIESFYEDTNYSWLPTRVACTTFDNDKFQFGLEVTITKAEANVNFPEKNWTLAGLNLPVGTAIVDRRTSLTDGYWNGTNVTPFEAWQANRQAVRDTPIPLKSQTRIFVWILLVGTAVFPLVLWKQLRGRKKI